MPIKNSWYGKDNTKWSKPAAVRGKTPAYNLFIILLVLAGPARNNPPSEPVDAWSILITNKMIQKMIDFTNLKITLARQTYIKSPKMFSAMKYILAFLY